MKRLVLASLAAALMSRAAHAQTFYTCGQGTVLNVQSVTEAVITRPAVPLPDEDDEGLFSFEMPLEAQSTHYYLVTVRLHDMVYTARSVAGAVSNLDPASLAMDQTISACADGTQLVLDRLDGTDFRGRIVRIEYGPRLVPADARPTLVKRLRQP